MTVKLLTEQHLQFLSLKGASQARLYLHLSKFHIVGNHMSWFSHECMGDGFYYLVHDFDGVFCNAILLTFTLLQ